MKRIDQVGVYLYTHMLGIAPIRYNVIEILDGEVVARCMNTGLLWTYKNPLIQGEWESTNEIHKEQVEQKICRCDSRHLFAFGHQEGCKCRK